MTIEELLAGYSDLEGKDFLARVEYAAKLVQVKSIYALHDKASRASTRILKSSMLEITQTEIAEHG